MSSIVFLFRESVFRPAIRPESPPVQPSLPSASSTRLYRAEQCLAAILPLVPHRATDSAALSRGALHVASSRRPEAQQETMQRSLGCGSTGIAGGTGRTRKALGILWEVRQQCQRSLKCAEHYQLDVLLSASSWKKLRLHASSCISHDHFP